MPTHERNRSDHGQGATFVECDVSGVVEIREAVAAADELGGVSVIVNDAGITHSDDFLETARSTTG